jgi:P4 family phage/plasmid primase-like protien
MPKTPLKKLNDFLEDNRVLKKDKITPYTHTSMGGIRGKYNISDDKLNDFLKLYSKVILESKLVDPENICELHITSKPKELGPLILDFDFKHDGKTITERQYNNQHIIQLIEELNTLIYQYLNIMNDESVHAYVLEKDTMCVDKNNNLKDGIHIHYPNLHIDVKLRFLLFHELKNKVESIGLFNDIECINDLNDIFDDSPIIRNGWMMYGSRKDTGQIYKLTAIYDKNLNNLGHNLYTPTKLVSILDNRHSTSIDELKLKDEFKDDEELSNKLKLYDPTSKKKKKTKTKIIINNDDGSDVDSDYQSDNDYEIIDKKEISENGKNNSDNEIDDIKLAKNLVELLSPTRAENYHDWVHVGWALHYVDSSLLSTFIKFSKKSKKYEKEGCLKIWREADDSGFTIASLKWWARLDNPKGYAKILRQQVNILMKEAETGTHDDISKVVYEMYKHQYVCISIKKNMWYEFQNHRWVLIENAYTLSNILSDCVVKEFTYLARYYLGLSMSESGQESDLYQAKSTTILKIVTKLKDHNFKQSIIAACANRFINKDFFELLDSNTDIIGFDNGVYDLKNLCFRKGVPDDYLTYSVGYDYKDYGFNSQSEINDPILLNVITYFQTVQPEKAMRDYLLTLIASYLDGKTKQQKFIIWTGSGSNGKSTTVNLLRYCLGEYFDILPVTVLTRKRGGSSNASPELADKKGKRCLIIQEPEHDDTVYVGQMKELTGSDWISARALYGDPFTYKPQFKLILTCNSLPSIPSTDGGTWRRLRVTPWESEFVDNPTKPNQFKTDRGLDEKMQDWKSAFMWYILKFYYRDYLNNGIVEPLKVKQFTSKYQEDSDIYQDFIANNLTITKSKSDKKEVGGVYSIFKTWYKESYNVATFPAKKDFIKNMINKNIEMRNNKFYGIEYNTSDSGESEDEDV